MRNSDQTRSGNLVVTYHYVRPTNSDGVTGVTPDEFESQIMALKAQFEVVTAEEFVAWHASRTDLALITFDDAVRDQYDYGFPILEKHGLPAVFFVPMRPYAGDAFPGDPAEWVRSAAADGWCTQHLLHALAQHLGWNELESLVAPHVKGVVVDDAAMNRLYHYEVARKRRLKYLMAFALPQARVSAILRSINNAGPGLRASDWFMTVNQLRELQDAGHSLGGHGFDHVPFTTLSSKEQATEMHRAARVMNELFGAMPRTIAYPYGRADKTTESLALGCGYSHAFSTENRVDAKDLTGLLHALV